MQATIEQEATLTLRLLAPFHLVVLRARLHIGAQLVAKAQDSAERAGLLSVVDEGIEVSELLCNAEGDFLRVDVRVVPSLPAPCRWRRPWLESFLTKTCLPALSACLMWSGCMRIGSAIMTARASERVRMSL